MNLHNRPAGHSSIQPHTLQLQLPAITASSNQHKVISGVIHIVSKAAKQAINAQRTTSRFTTSQTGQHTAAHPVTTSPPACPHRDFQPSCHLVYNSSIEASVARKIGSTALQQLRQLKSNPYIYLLSQETALVGNSDFGRCMLDLASTLQSQAFPLSSITWVPLLIPSAVMPPSRAQLAVGGMWVNVYGLSELLASGVTEVVVLVFLHGRWVHAPVLLALVVQFQPLDLSTRLPAPFSSITPDSARRSE